MTNNTKDEKTLTIILELNDYLNKLFDSFLITPDTNRDNMKKLPTPREPKMEEEKEFENTTKGKKEDEELCIICLELKITHACIPCGHLKYCEKCIKITVDRNECAVCRAKVQSVYKIFT